jgi:hypothetical protein
LSQEKGPIAIPIFLRFSFHLQAIMLDPFTVFSIVITTELTVAVLTPAASP